MKLSLAFIGFASVLSIESALRTTYKSGQALRVERDTAVVVKITKSTFERDGEPVNKLRGEPERRMRKTITYVDQIEEVEGGVPKKLKRTFESNARQKNLQCRFRQAPRGTVERIDARSRRQQ